MPRFPAYLSSYCKLCFVLMLLFIVTMNVSKIQAQDTAKILSEPIPLAAKTKHSPHRATLYAMVFPGLGQIYNRKYWKLPIVYAGFGACIYFIKYNNGYYQDLKDAYEWASVTNKTTYPPTPPFMFDSIPAEPNEYAIKYSEDQLKSFRDTFRKDLEISYIFTGVWYVLTVVDAVVDAHFFDYDINNDLSLRVKPWVPAPASKQAFGFSGGLNLTLRF